MLRIFVAICALAAALTSATAQDRYPNRVVRIIVPVTPGGSMDFMGRAIGKEFETRFGQPVVIENRPGGTTSVGANVVARSAPDGYTLLLTCCAHTIVPALLTVPYDTATAFLPISAMVKTPQVITVKPDFPAKTMRDLVEMARAKPGTVTYSTSGVGTTTHLMISELERATGVKFNHVPFKGAPEAIQAVMGGHIDFNAGLSPVALPLIQGGEVRALAVTGESRSPLFPDTPVFAESGYPEVRGESWYGLLAPAGTPSDIIEKWHEVISSYLKRDEVRQELQRLGFEIMDLGPEQFRALINRELVDREKLVKEMNLKQE